MDKRVGFVEPCSEYQTEFSWESLVNLCWLKHGSAQMFLGKSLVGSKVLIKANLMFYGKTCGWRQNAYKSKFNNLYKIPLWIFILIGKVDER